MQIPIATLWFSGQLECTARAYTRRIICCKWRWGWHHAPPSPLTIDNPPCLRSWEARPLRDNWATTKFWQISQRSFSEHSMISKVFRDFSMIFQWTLWSVWCLSNFELVQNSLSVIFEGSRKQTISERSAISQWALNGLTSLSMISQQSVQRM